METLNPTAQRIQDILSGLETNYRVVEFTESTRTAQEAADRVGCQLGQIVKSLVFKALKSNKAVLILASGSNRVDEKGIAQYVGEAITRADPDFVRRMTGFAIGGVPPIGLAQPMETFIDEDLLQFTDVWSAAGTPNAVFKLLSSDLAKITSGKVVRIKL